MSAALESPELILVGQKYPFYAEMQQEYLPVSERMRNYTGTEVLVISECVVDDPENQSRFFIVETHDGRRFEAAEEELCGWDYHLGQYFWPDGTYGPEKLSICLANEHKRASKAKVEAGEATGSAST